jgi:hypothetical protein
MLTTSIGEAFGTSNEDARPVRVETPGIEGVGDAPVDDRELQDRDQRNAPQTITSAA